MQITRRLYDMKKEELAKVEELIKEQTAEITRLHALGDISENAEYDFAVSERSMLKNQYKDLITTLENAEIIEVEDTTRITIGSFLRLQCSLDGSDTETEKIVLFDGIEDYHNGIIGPQSNLGKKIYGMDASNPIRVTVETPLGKTAVYQVTKLRNCNEDQLYNDANPGLTAKLRAYTEDIKKHSKEVEESDMAKLLQGNEEA